MMQTSLSGRTGPKGGRLVDMDNGYVVELFAATEQPWQLNFYDRDLRAVPAPNVDMPKITGIKIEAVGVDRIVRTLVPEKGPDETTLIATGKIHKAAEYARVHMSRGDHWVARHVQLNGKVSEKVPAGPKGGHFIDMGHNQYIELVAQADGSWQLCFYENENRPLEAPHPTLIGAEALGGDGSISALVVAPGPDRSTLIATGKTQNAVRARILWAHPEEHNPHWHRREIYI